MNTEIDQPQIFYTVYLQKSSPFLPHFKVIGAYTDIRDAVQAIASAYRRNGGHYSIDSSPNQPKHWLHPTKYK